MKKVDNLRKIKLLLLLLCISLAAKSQVVTVAGDGSSAFTLRNTIAAAAPNATITIAPTVTSVVLTQGEITINKNLTIVGSTVINPVISGNLVSRIFNVSGATLTLSNLNLSNGVAADGGAMFINSSNVTVNNCTFMNNVANAANGSGGAIYLGTGGMLTANNSSFNMNQANRAGGAIEAVAGTMMTIQHTDFDNNNAGVLPATAAPGNGGAIHITGAGTANINGGVYSNNQAAAEGGALWNGSGTMTADSVMVMNNTAAGAAANNGGGGFYNLSNGTLIISNATIANNSATGAAGSGGGILNDVDGTLTVSNTSIKNNTSIRAGGGIEGTASGGSNSITLMNVHLDSNNTMSSPGNGGGLHMTGAGMITITGGTVMGNQAAAEGGGLWNGSGTMTVDSVMIMNNIASGADATNGGGGIYNLNGGTLVVSNTTFSNNQADGASGSGGGLFNDVGGQVTLSSSVFIGNSASRAGGAIEDNSGTSTMLITDVDFRSNIAVNAPGNGGAIHITGGGSADITGGVVVNNSAGREGGGLWNGSGLMTVTNVRIDSNMALGAAADDGGAGIFNNGGDMILVHSSLTGNMAVGSAASGGGMLSLTGDIHIDSCDFMLNAANRAGGAIELIDGNLWIRGSQFVENDVDGTAGTPAPGNGGAIHITGSTMSWIDATVFTNNRAGREGGALWNQNNSIMTIDSVTIDGNIANGDGASFGGGGLFVNGGAVVVSNSTISNNSSNGASGNGGGIHVKSGSSTITTSTISGNSSAEHGGGVYCNDTLSLNAVTIADNMASANGGGIATVSNAPVDIKNTIVATNTGTDKDLHTSGTMYNSMGYNLIGELQASTMTTMTTDITGTAATPVDPMLSPLALNGHTTMTHEIDIMSPAYNAGDPSDMMADQRGIGVFGPARDIGSYESNKAPVSVQDIVSDQMFTLYPNPAINYIQINDTKDIQVEKIKVLSAADGRIVREFDSLPKNGILNISGLTSGMYLVQLNAGNDVFSTKLVIQ